MPKDTFLADAIGLPEPRRGFLRTLVNLPLVGGSLAMICAPATAAEPVTNALLVNHKTWLQMEHRFLCYEIVNGNHELIRPLEDIIFFLNDAAAFHQWPNSDKPSSRAAIVLSAVGCTWNARRDPLADMAEGISDV